jgi:hypothetical protein
MKQKKQGHPYLRLNDFDTQISLRDAYEIMLRFVTAYHNRGESPTGDLLADTMILTDGCSCDPAQLYDFLDAYKRQMAENKGTLRSGEAAEQ